MSPEYAMDGLFSEKSDVFSFGVILLEIISGNKNIAFFEADHSLNLLGKVSTFINPFNNNHSLYYNENLMQNIVCFWSLSEIGHKIAGLIM